MPSSIVLHLNGPYYIGASESLKPRPSELEKTSLVELHVIRELWHNTVVLGHKRMHHILMFEEVDLSKITIGTSFDAPKEGAGKRRDLRLRSCTLTHRDSSSSSNWGRRCFSPQLGQLIFGINFVILFQVLDQVVMTVETVYTLVARAVLARMLREVARMSTDVSGESI